MAAAMAYAEYIVLSTGSTTEPDRRRREPPGHTGGTSPPPLSASNLHIASLYNATLQAPHAQHHLPVRCRFSPRAPPLSSASSSRFTRFMPASMCCSSGQGLAGTRRAGQPRSAKIAGAQSKEGHHATRRSQWGKCRQRAQGGRGPTCLTCTCRLSSSSSMTSRCKQQQQW